MKHTLIILSLFVLCSCAQNYTRGANRFHSLYGAGRAAEELGDTATATRYYTMLTALAENADPEQARLQRANAFLAAR